MLAPIVPGPPVEVAGLAPNRHVDRLLRSARCGEPIEIAINAILAEWGFETFMYAMSATLVPGRRDTRAFVWTTLPKEWVAMYSSKGYVEIDPRVTQTYNRNLPYVWDAADFVDDPRTRAFFADAAKFDVRSGVAVSFRDPDHGRVLVALNSKVSPISVERRAEIAGMLGDMVLLATGFHDFFMASIVDKGDESVDRKTPLSPRELQCLELAANGMTSADIGTKLDIAERTANYHFKNLISKLGVLNRQEAVAVGIARGIVRRHPAVMMTAPRPDDRSLVSSGQRSVRVKRRVR